VEKNVETKRCSQNVWNFKEKDFSCFPNIAKFVLKMVIYDQERQKNLNYTSIFSGQILMLSFEPFQFILTNFRE